MRKRRPGTSSLEVSAIGLGCMIGLLRSAVERGITFFDTAEVYGGIDLFYQHRVNPDVPIEHVAGAAPLTIRRAHAVQRVTAEVELTPGDLAEIENAASKIDVQGARYPEHLERMTGL